VSRQSLVNLFFDLSALQIRSVLSVSGVPARTELQRLFDNAICRRHRGAAGAGRQMTSSIEVTSDGKSSIILTISLRPSAFVLAM
jgi:hypothetical protein